MSIMMYMKEKERARESERYVHYVNTHDAYDRERERERVKHMQYIRERVITITHEIKHSHYCVSYTEMQYRIHTNVYTKWTQY